MGTSISEILAFSVFVWVQRNVSSSSNLIYKRDLFCVSNGNLILSRLNSFGIIGVLNAFFLFLDHHVLVIIIALEKSLRLRFY